MPAEVPGRDWARIGIALALAWFALRLLAFAWAIDPGVPPDEETHVGRILAYAQTWGWPSAGPENHALGLLSQRPFLYNWVLARAVNLGLDGLLALRLLNVALALGTAFYALRFIRCVSSNGYTHLLFILMLTNTLMFTGIGAAVSYDNATNLFAAAAFYYSARLLRGGGSDALAPLLLALGLGCLTKRSFLPLAALLVAAIVLHERRQLMTYVGRIDWRTESARLARPAWALVAVVILANAALYGGNLARFGKLVPSFDQVVGVEAARSNRIFARDYILDGYREGRLGFREAMAATAQIAHEADRRSTIGQLNGTRERIRKGANARLGIGRYTLWWCRLMLERSMGYFGHEVLWLTAWQRIAFGALLLLAVSFQVSAWRRPQAPGLWLCAGVAATYALVLLLLVNRPTYLEKGLLDAGVQGRYLFPIWVPLMGFLAVGLWEAPPKRLRVALAGAACALFLWSDAPSLWLRAGPSWFSG